MTDTAQVPAEAGAATPVVPNASTPAEKQDQAAPAEAAVEPQTEAKDDPSKSEAETADKKDDAKRNSIKERIDRERSKRTDAERRLEASERTNRELQRQLREMGAEFQKLDPNDVEGRAALNMRASVKAERLEQSRAEAEAAAHEAASTRQAIFNAKIDAARERFSDLDQVLGDFSRKHADGRAAVPVSEVAADLIAESDKAVELMYFLTKNPGEAHRINALPPHMQGREIARLETRVAAAPARKASNAPPPVQTRIGGGSSPVSKSLSELASNMDEYAAARRAEMAKGS